MRQASSATDCEILTLRLQEYIPNAQLASTALPEVPEMKLWLLSADYPQQDLSPEQTQRIMNYPAYWVFCWASGQVLARYILDNPHLVQGKRILDFGSGSGVAGIAAKLAGAASVIACDLDPDALLASRVNADLNGVALEYSDDFFASNEQYDLILVADVLYDKSNFPLLPAFLARAPQVLIADSRVRNFQFEGYGWLAYQRATTVPDLAESDEFSKVNLYWGCSGVDA